MPEWSEWRKCLVYDQRGKLVECQQRYNYDNLTIQTLVGDVVWTATMEEQRREVEAYRKEMGL